MKNIQWTTQGGAKIEISVESNFELNTQGNRRAGGQKIVEVTARHNGEEHFAPLGIRYVSGHPIAVASIGKIGITAEQMKLIEKAIEAVETDIASHNTALDQHAETLDALGNGDINTVLGDHC